MSKMTLCGVILAGGKSSRMGTPKELLEWEGEPLLLHLVDMILAAGLPCLVISNHPELLPHKELQQAGVQLATDAVESHGPISGIHTAFSLREEEALLILSCDLPFIEQRDIQQLLLQTEFLQQYDAVVAHADGNLHPLLALYHRRTEPFWQEALQHGNYKVMNVIDKLRMKQMDEDILSQWATYNMNTPDQYQFAKKRRTQHAISTGDPDGRGSRS